MIAFLFILLILIFYDATVMESGEYNTSYLDKTETRTINGIFVVLIIFSHYAQYADFSGSEDMIYMCLRSHMGQLVVVPILFYSGFGMMVSIQKKGIGYVKKIPVKFFKLLFKVDCAVMLFYCLNLCLGIECTGKQLVKSLLLWDSIGNSNWYIFDILAMYIIMYICFMIPLPLKGKLKDTASAILVLFCTVGLVYLLKTLGRDLQWYNTIIIFPVGILFAIFCKDIERIIWKKDITYALCTASIITLYLFVFKFKDNYGLEVYSIWIMLFITGLILLTMKIWIHSPVLEWCGQHIFSIYILQRLPMIVLTRMGWVNSNKYLSLIMAISITVIISLAFETVTDKCIDAVGRVKKKTA